MNDHIKTAAEISSILKSRFELAADVKVTHPGIRGKEYKPWKPET